MQVKVKRGQLETAGRPEKSRKWLKRSVYRIQKSIWLFLFFSQGRVCGVEREKIRGTGNPHSHFTTRLMTPLYLQYILFVSFVLPPQSETKTHV